MHELIEVLHDPIAALQQFSNLRRRQVVLQLRRDRRGFEQLEPEVRALVDLCDRPGAEGVLVIHADAGAFAEASGVVDEHWAGAWVAPMAAKHQMSRMAIRVVQQHVLHDN
jgi:hypothetical protein